MRHDPRYLAKDQAEAFDRDGFVVLRGVFTADEIAAVRAVGDEADAGTELLLRELPEGRAYIAEAGAITFSVHAVSRSSVAADFSRHPVALALCADLVGEDVRLYWDQFVYKKPEKPRRFPWHQDNGYAFVLPQQYLTLWVPLTTATVDNGCPWLAPGRHREGTLAHRFVDPLGWECLGDVVDAVPAEVTVGDVVVFSSLTPHLTGPNNTHEVRKAYILQYAPDGAAVLWGDPDAGPPSGAVPAAVAERQYRVLAHGAPVPA